ncbi:phage tail assembly chaperone [Jiella marina]|uniref:phage tail assembly chaperone n=1 Tax=Jiella sp. LLJ827 TaxID=2917712 RepID=UPI002101C9B9|nr:phage tail assembly chaperone [Jiella sp. LLJ827]MCQ0986026.1 phage tail assembly chaperone [Jiella sp. LLJ827]
MNSRLASEQIRITLDGRPVELVPSLRAALRLARRYGTYADLIAKLADGSTAAMADTIAEGSDLPAAYDMVNREIIAGGVMRLALIIPALIDFVISLAGPSSDEKGNGKSTGKPITFEAFHEGLFEIATGWLGWTPAEAWAATPGEIIAANKGRVAMLRAIFGGGEGNAETKAHDELSLDDQALAVFGRRRKGR